MAILCCGGLVRRTTEPVYSRPVGREFFCCYEAFTFLVGQRPATSGGVGHDVWLQCSPGAIIYATIGAMLPVGETPALVERARG